MSSGSWCCTASTASIFAVCRFCQTSSDTPCSRRPTSPSCHCRSIKSSSAVRRATHIQFEPKRSCAPTSGYIHAATGATGGLATCDGAYRREGFFKPYSLPEGLYQRRCDRQSFSTHQRIGSEINSNPYLSSLISSLSQAGDFTDVRGVAIRIIQHILLWTWCRCWRETSVRWCLTFYYSFVSGCVDSVKSPQCLP